MKGCKPKTISFILSFALILTMSLIPVTVEALPPNFTFTDTDADHVYFGGDTLSFSYSTTMTAGTPVVAEFYLMDTNMINSTGAGILTGCSSIYRISCDTDTTDIIEVSGTIADDLSDQPSVVGVKFFAGGTTTAHDGTEIGTGPYPVSNGTDTATVGLDSIFDNFPTKAGITNGFFVNDEFNRNQSFNLGAANVTFSMIINYPAPSTAAEIIGSMAFTNLNMLDSASMMQLGELANSITMDELTAGPGYEDEFEMGLDTSQTTFLASIGASLSLKDPGFSGSAGSNFTIAPGAGQTGTASAISFDDSTDTLTFDVSHFSDYKISRTASSGGGDGDGGGHGGGSGSGGNQTPANPQPTNTLKENTMTSSVTLTGTQNAAGKTTASVTNETFAPMIEKAKTAETAGQKPVVEIKVDSSSAAKEVVVDIPKTSFNQLADQTKAQVSVNSSLGTVTFDEDAVQAINEKAGSDIQISMAKVENAGLSSEIQAIVGDAPVYDFTVQSGNSKISDFDGGSASISVPYSLKEGDDPNAVVVYYINDAGALETVRGAYDPDTKTVKFVTDHFSKYAIAYNEVSFADVADSAWYSDAVGFIAARGITTGTDKTHFSPNAKLSRAQFLVMVMKAYGIEPAVNASDNFADAGNTYYTAYLAKAKELGIANGGGNNLFGPNKNITRQDMFTLLYRTLDLIGEVPEAAGNAALSDFTDAESITDYAKTPMKTLVSSGVVTGSNDMLSPKNTTTRAEMAQVLFNLLSK